MLNSSCAGTGATGVAVDSGVVVGTVAGAIGGAVAGTIGGCVVGTTGGTVVTGGCAGSVFCSRLRTCCSWLASWLTCCCRPCSTGLTGGWLDSVVEFTGVITVLVLVMAVVGDVLEVWKFQRVLKALG